MTKTQQQLQTQFPQFNFKFDFSLRDISYFKIGGPAEIYLELKNRNDIIDLVRFCFANNIKLTMLGGASNVIVADEGIKGLVLHPGNNEEIEIEDTSKTNQKLVRAQAGIKTSILVRKTIDANLTGLEYFLGIPGTLGGAVYNNAHYMQNLMSQYIHRVEVINKQGEVKWLGAADCEFAYDFSRFHHSVEIILRVEFLLEKGDAEKSQQLIQEATVYRAQTQPLGEPSSGCIFQNVPNDEHLQQVFPKFRDKPFIPCGYIIDQTGLKGERHGGIKVSEKHAAFMINTGNGTANEIKDLINIVKRKVKDKYGIELKEEVFWLE